MKRILAGLAASAALGIAAQAWAAPLRPHQAVYDLSLSGQTEDILAVEGRIALTLNAKACGEYDLDYRFAARFHKDGETTVTDQRTRSVEADNGRAYRFETTTFVDGLDQGTVRGTASNAQDATTVSLQEPVIRDFSLPASHFPLDHTAMLIERARKGQRFVEARLFDGDPEAEKLMTTTSIILPAATGASGDKGRDFAGLASWTVDESYFNSDSDEDGLPIFRARYRLYENGVSDEMTLDFGDYALKGSLTSLTYLSAPDCR
ncbi:EipB family protein [Aureimonas frigidaquae]|uniref:EipB family protein n=1 Tax=Aureimonas frigidaquae TaxID=424757 RepID=UPI000785F6F5|nr:DUF1849 family protein [Aureimonas frigidaquae]